MIIDQLPLLSGDVESTDEIPIERGTTTYKTTQAALVKSAADAAAAAQSTANAAQSAAGAAQSAAGAAQTTADGKAPTSHASTATTYGVGNASNYGHVKLSDTPDANQDAGDGVAATPAAVQAAIAFEDITSAFTPKSGVNLQALKIGNMVIVRAKGQRANATTEWELASIPAQYRPSDSRWVGAAHLNSNQTGVCTFNANAWNLVIPPFSGGSSWCVAEITWILGTPAIS